MTLNTSSVPNNESGRAFNLASYDIDYAALQEQFKDLATLAAKIAGTEISLVNLIDTFTQWTVAKHGVDLSQMPREDSVCQYTIKAEDHFEVNDLTVDERFKDKDYVTGALQLKYYFGVPLTTSEGHNIGALCVLDTSIKSLSDEKLELLKIVADEIVKRLNDLKTINALRASLAAIKEAQKQVAHGIRSPIAGIIGLTGLLMEQGETNAMDDLMESVSLIERSSRTALETANEIFAEKQPLNYNTNDFNLRLFKEKLEELYARQAQAKGVSFTVNISERTQHVLFMKNKLLQIAGNLIGNAIKFTCPEGSVIVDLVLKPEATHNVLEIKVKDSGIGMNASTIEQVMHGQVPETGDGLSGDEGYVFGLSLVKHMTEDMNGQFVLKSIEDGGTTVQVSLIQGYI